MSDCDWGPPPAILRLASNDVHIWRASLDQPLSLIQQLRQSCAADELSRAKRFHFEKDRRRFLVARAGLRHILSYYTKTPAGELGFGYSEYGKPCLTFPAGLELRFNLSHSGDFGLYAVTWGREIGIDIEQIRPMADIEQIARRFFSARENMALQAIPEPQKETAFFNCWTRKEAYIKAIGEGLSRPLDSFDVSFAPGEPAALLTIRDAPQDISRWSLHGLVPAPGYAAALVVEGRKQRLTCWQWSSIDPFSS